MRCFKRRRGMRRDGSRATRGEMAGSAQWRKFDEGGEVVRGVEEVVGEDSASGPRGGGRDSFPEAVPSGSQDLGGLYLWAAQISIYLDRVISVTGVLGTRGHKAGQGLQGGGELRAQGGCPDWHFFKIQWPYKAQAKVMVGLGGVQTTIVPQMGDILIYRAEDMHNVDEVTHGERCTLALWFTLDSSCDEDAKILNSIRLSPMNSPLPEVHIPSMGNYYLSNESMWMPLPGSSSMYIINFADESKEPKRKRTQTLTHQSDLRVARSRALGFEFCIPVDKSFVALGEIEAQSIATFEVLQDALERPMKLKSDGHVVPYIFANSIHALQVIYFCKWKESEQQGAETRAEIVEKNEADANCARSPVTGLASTQSSVSGGDISTLDDDSLHAGGGAAKATITKDFLERALHSKDWEHYMAGYYDELQRCLPAWNHFKCISAHVSDARTPQNLG